MDIKNVGIVLFFIMFIYSGYSKILHFDKKTQTLGAKTGLPHIINVIGMISVIVLEIIGSLLIIHYFLYGQLSKELIKNILKVYLAFMVVVTFLYHPPTDKLIPFLSNVTTLGGFVLVYTMV